MPAYNSIEQRGNDAAEMRGLASGEVGFRPCFSGRARAHNAAAHGAGWRKTRVRQDLVRGKPGHLVRVGAASWLMEPQADVTAADSVAVPSRPDFLLRPVRGRGPARPARLLAILPAPEVGFELTDGKGQVLAEAELAWPTQRVAVLHGEQAEEAAAFEEAGWRVLSAAEGALAEQVVKALVD